MTVPSPAADATAEDLAAFIEAAPTPFHAVAEAGRRLSAAGFTRVAWGDDPPGPGPGFTAVDGALVAWVLPRGNPGRPFRMIGAHTDSPDLRVRPLADGGAEGWRQLNVEVYGGALWNSWLDRDLAVAGRAVLRDSTSPTGRRSELFRSPRAVARIPQLAIHLDRGVNSEGLRLNPQVDLAPVWGLGAPTTDGFRGYVADLLGAAPADVVTWDASLFDAQPPGRLGREAELLAAARLDNLCSSHAAVTALCTAAGRIEDLPHVPVIVLFDHEEIGSVSPTGADSAFLTRALERLLLAEGEAADTLHRRLASSSLLSADMAHATHPNHPERHEPYHRIRPGGGPAIKHNVNRRYATDADTAAAFRLACESAGVPVQDYSHRGDLPCGSTIGPITAAGLAVPTVDVGVPQLSMHSARELVAVEDVHHGVRAFTAWLAATA